MSVEAARGIEAYFIRQLLGELMPSSGGGAQFNAMLNEALGDAIARAGGLGLAAELAPQLGGGGGEELAAQITAARARGPVVAGTMTSKFGARVDPIDGEMNHHHGVDLAAPIGTPVAAARAGTVARVESSETGYGNLVVVDHGGGLETRYAHLDSIGVAVGQHLAAGEQLGTVGSTGRSTGPHLHFEARVNGASVDPQFLLR